MRMGRYLIPAMLSAILIAIVVSVNLGFKSLANYFTADFALGFLAGGAFCILLYGVICWIDPASRPRGSNPAAEHQRPRNLID